MDAMTLHEQLDAWASTTFTADMRLDVDFVNGGRGHLIGHLPDGASEPSGGRRTRVIDLKFSFPSAAAFREIERFAERVKGTLEHDPYLGGRLHPDPVRYRELHVEGGKGSYGEGSWLVTVTVAHTQSE